MIESWMKHWSEVKALKKGMKMKTESWSKKWKKTEERIRDFDVISAAVKNETENEGMYTVKKTPHKITEIGNEITH